MQIVDTNKIYEYDCGEGAKIFWRRFPQIFIAGLLSSKEMEGITALTVNDNKVTEETKDIAREYINRQAEIAVKILKHPHSIVKWEGLKDDITGKNVAFDRDIIEGLPTEIILDLYNLCLTGNVGEAAETTDDTIKPTNIAEENKKDEAVKKKVRNKKKAKRNKKN